MTIMQGDSYPIYFDLKQDGKVLTPEMVADVEVYVGDVLSKFYTEDGVMFDEESRRWYIHPSRQETMELPAETYRVIAFACYKGTTPEQAIGTKVGWIVVEEGTRAAKKVNSEAVI